MKQWLILRRALKLYQTYITKYFSSLDLPAKETQFEPKLTYWNKTLEVPISKFFTSNFSDKAPDLGSAILRPVLDSWQN